ncbi:HIRAN domain-containing protein [Acetivibrio sp. MSJd-27]|uniref:HIRAN domain-containing protein n=1 Tax=Acetivibrio sp. MSJd-27 TaxID=2841523 RepID=UPI0015ADC0FE|nr:HIRAN domain-containing protein [Acetivibrio sp. MSJd-27]MBU5451038.1 HIRAN domain-containing protein [Acetivibrio sp. MSJd-27]
MNTIYVTITGQNHYLGMKPYKIGRIVKLVKEPDNAYDPEAIRVELPYIDTIGYVANSVNTVFEGTCSAGRAYDKFDDYAYGEVMFITHSSVIAAVRKKEDVEKDGMSDGDVVSF